ncbi:hypothetical protein ABC666_15400, partial [Lacticaseibacillus paracasei]
LKADQSVVNTINGSVNQLRADLKVANDRLSLTMTKNDVTGLLTPYATQSWTQGQITATASQFNAQFNSINQRLQTEDRPNLIKGKWQDLRTWDKNTPANNAVKSIDYDNTVNVINYLGVASVEELSTTLPTEAGNHYLLTVDWDAPDFNPNDGSGWGRGVDLGFDADNHAVLESNVTNKRFILTFTAKGNDKLLLRFGNVPDGRAFVFKLSHLNLELDTSSQATVTQFSNLKLTVDGLTTTVANNHGQVTTALQTLQGFQQTATNQLTGLQSQQTQLSNQLTSVVGGIGQKNLVYNSEIVTLDGWTTNTNIDIGTNQYDSFNGSNSLRIRNSGLGPYDWRYVYSKSVNVVQGMKYSISGTLFFTGNLVLPTPKAIFLEIDFFDAEGKRVGFSSVGFDISRPYDHQLLKLEGIVPPANAVTVVLAVQVSGGNYNIMLNHPMLVAAPTVGAYQPDTIGGSQLTQLQDAINLRVSKGDVLSQINLEANRTLIQSGKLVLDAPTVVFTGSAFIPSAAIASLSADKITT